MNNVIFVTGIDTNVGKSFATGYLAKQLSSTGNKVITQKFIQTGNTGISEDIEIHRKIMGTGLLPEDIDGTTCPVILSYPASPHLAAQIDNTEIDIDRITNATNILKQKYDIVLIEGAGGIMVPINRNYTTLDYIKDLKIPVLIVTSSKLGSINHTLMTIEICRHENIEIATVAYNKFNITDELICKNTEDYLKDYLKKNLGSTSWIEIPEIIISE
jgi:dethiobiotin synthetase